MAISFNPGDLQRSYDAVSKIASGESPQQSYNEPMREMTGPEHYFASLANFGNAISSSSGFGEYYQSHGGLASLASPEGIARFAINLPSGMAGALPSGIANLYAAGSGADVTYGADLQNNMIREQELDAWQRAASAVTGLIDTAGLALGGSGSALNEIGRAWKAGKSAEAAARTGAGARVFGLSGSGLLNKDKLTPAGAFVYDVAEEAGEEAIQSISEDVIQKQLDENSVGRALEGAFMGALGGGMMSGGALALHSATESDIEKATAANKNGSKTTDAYSAFEELLTSNLKDGNIFAPEAVKELRQKRELDKYTQPMAGSVMATLFNSGEVTSIDDIIPGIEELRTIWRQSTSAEDQLLSFFNGGQEGLFKDANGNLEGKRISRENLAAHLMSADEETACTMLNNLLDSVYGKDGTRKVIALRNPATTEGAVWMNVKAIGTGRGFDMSGNTAMLIGGDFDGDRAALFFSPTVAGFSPEVWASQVIYRQETGEASSRMKNPSLINWVYGSGTYSPDSDTKKAIDESIFNRLRSLNLSKVQARAIKEQIMAAYDSAGDPSVSSSERNVKLNEAFRNIELAVAQAVKEDHPDWDDRSVAGVQRKAVNEIVSAFAEPRISPVQYAKQKAAETINNLEELLKESDTGSFFPTSAGSGNGYGTAAAGYQAGIPGWFTTSDYDQFYRNYATQVYTYVKEHKLDVKNALGEDNVMSAYGKLVQYACHVLTQGTTPVKSIVGMIDTMVELKFMENWQKAEDYTAQLVPEERDKMIQSYVDAYNDFVDVYNDSLKIIRDNKLADSYIAPERHKINMSKEGWEIRFGSEFSRMFALEPISKFIPAEILPDGIDPMMPLADAVAVTARSNLKISLVKISDALDSSAKFYDMLVRAKRSEGRKIQSLAVRAYKEFIFSGIRDRMRDGKLDPNDIEALRAFANWVYSALNVDAAFDAQFLDPERWIGTEIGQMMISGDEKQFLNACTIINFGGKFLEFLEYRRSNPTKDFTADQLDKLNALASIDVIHEEIVNQLLAKNEDGKYSLSGILEMLLNSGISFDQKQTNITKFFHAKDASIDNALYMSGLSGAPNMTSCDIDESLATKLRKGSSYVSQYRKVLYDNARTEATSIRKMFVEHPELPAGKRLVDVMRYALTRNSFRISMKPLSILMADMASVTNRQPEKGNANDLAGAFYVMMDVYHNGKQTSFDADTFGTPFGNYMKVDLAQNPDLLCNILADPEFSIHVWDGERDCEFNRDALFSEVSAAYRESPTKELTDMMWCDLFDALPNLLSYLGGVEMSFATSDGGLSTSLSRSGSFLDFCKDYINRQNDPNYDAAMRGFYDASNDLAGVLLKDLRVYKFLFANMSNREKSKAMRGFEPSEQELWSGAQSLARCILALKMRSSNGATGAVRCFGNTIRTNLTNSIQSEISRLYNGIITSATGEISRSISGISGMVNTALSDAVAFEAINLAGKNNIEYQVLDENGNQVTKTINLNAISSDGDLHFKFNDEALPATITDALQELTGILFTVQSVFDTFDSSQDQYVDAIISALMRAGITDSATATSIASSIWNDYTSSLDSFTSQAAQGIAGNLSNALILKTDPMFEKHDRQAFLEKLKTLGGFVHDDRFIRFAETVDAKNATDRFSFSEASDLLDLYDALFDDDGNPLAPSDPRVPWNAREKLLVRFSNYALAYSLQRHSLDVGRVNPYELSDRYDFISLVEEFLKDPEVDEVFNRYNKVSGGKGFDDKIDKFISDFNVPYVLSAEESAYMNQFMEAVSAGRVISNVGINGSEVLNTAALSFVPENKTLPFEFSNPKSGQEILDMLHNGEIDIRTHISIRDEVTGEKQMVVLEDVEGLLLDNPNDKYDLYDRKINPHGIFYGPQPEPRINEYGVKYKSALGILNRLHMAGMENLVLKVRKAFDETASKFIMDRRKDRMSGTTFDSQQEFSGDNARISYENFIESAAKKILEDIDYRKDLAKIGIREPEIMAIVQLMTVGYSVTYRETITTPAGRTETRLRKATLDIMHVYDGSFDSRLNEILSNGEFVSSELMVVPLRAVSDRIERAVFSISQDPNNEQTPADAAFAAMTNWDDYVPGQLSAVDVARSFSPLGRTHDYIAAERTETALQSLYGEIWGKPINGDIPVEHNVWNSKKYVFYDRGDNEYTRSGRHQIKDKLLSFDSDLGDIAISNVFGISRGDRAAEAFGISPRNDNDYKGVIDQFAGLRSDDSKVLVNGSQGVPVQNIVLCFDVGPSSAEFKNACMYAAATGATLMIPAAKQLYFSEDYGRLRNTDVKIVLEPGIRNGAELDLMAVDLSDRAKDPTVVYNNFEAARRDINPQERFITLMLDAKGIYANIGEASLRFKKSVAARFVSRGEQKQHEINLRSLVDERDGESYRFESLNEADFNLIKSLDPENAESWNAFSSAITKLASKSSGLGFIDNGERYIRQAVAQFVSRVDEAHDLVDTMGLSGTVGGSCVGIVKAVPISGASPKYIPIIAPLDMQSVVSGSVSRLDGSATARITYWEQVDFNQPGIKFTFKSSGSSRAADKGIAYVVDDGILPDAVDGVENYETVSGRMKGRDHIILYTNLSNYMQMHYYNMFFKRDESGNLDLSEAFKDFIKKRADGKTLMSNTIAGTFGSSLAGKSFWDLLCEDDPDAWAVLDVNNCGVSNPATARENIKRAIRTAAQYQIPISEIFGCSSYTVEFVRRERDTAATGNEFEEVPVLKSINTVQQIPTIDLVFRGWAWNDICDFFSVVGKNFSLMESYGNNISGAEKASVFNRDGWMYVDEKNGYQPVLIDDLAYLGHASVNETPGGAAAISLQQRINKLMMYGYDTTTLDFVNAFAKVLSDDAASYRRYDSYNLGDLNSYDTVAMGGALFNNYGEYEKELELEDLILSDSTWTRDIVGSDGKLLSSGDLSKTKEGREILKAVAGLKDALGIKGELSMSIVHRIVNHIDGSTQGDFENPTIYASTFVKHINTATKNVNEHGLLVTDSATAGRVSIPVFDPSFIKYICSVSNLNYDEYVDAMWKQEELTLKRILDLPNTKAAQRLALQNFAAAMRKSWRDAEAHSWRDYGFTFGGLTVQDMAANDTVLTRFAERLGFDPGAFKPLSDLGKQLMDNQRKLFEKSGIRRSIQDDTTWTGRLHQDSVSTDVVLENRLDDMVTFTRGMAVLNIGVVAGNTVGRYASQGFMDLLLNIGASSGFGPFAGHHQMQDDTMEVLLGDQNMFDSYLAIREMGVTGDDSALLAAQNTAELVEKLSEMRSGRSSFNKIATKVFNTANGRNYGMKQQIKIFWRRFIHFIEAEPSLAPYLEINPNTGRMYIEDEIRKDGPAAFFLSCFVPNGAASRPELYLCAQQALNSAMTGDMAQRHWLASFLHHALKDRPLANFLFSTTICKFPRYQFNLVDKALNWFAPMSTLNYVLTHAAMKVDEHLAAKAEAEGREYTPFNFELDQRFVNAREAMAYDVAHMGPMAVAAVLLEIGNAIEPPDDEKKWGDPDEWLIVGYRVGSSWWLGDLLGAFLPSVLFTKSCMLGNPTSSLLVNGALSACYGNPFLRAADVCDTLTSWNDAENLTSYVNACEQYKDAEKGNLGFLDWIGANSVSAAANLITNAVTPSQVREWYRNSSEFERSYKKVYATTPTGKISEKGEEGRTVDTTYFDAQMRRACRNNPFLAVVMDLLHPNASTGYWLDDMPYTQYYDEAQMSSAEEYSIKGLSEQKAEEKLSEIYLLLRANDVSDLQKQGFYLDSETLYALGSYLWDTYYGYEQEWHKLGESGALSYTVLGNGDFDLGKQRYHQLYNIKEQHKQIIKDVYNKKIKGSYLSQAPQTYLRYSTSYRTDADGEVYATGYRRQGVLPFVTAPGTLTDPEGTAGYENDFSSISAVTGEPMGQRALIPVDREYLDLPAFAGFSANGDGQGYSGKWSRYSDSGSGSTTPSGSTSGLKYPDGSDVPEGIESNSGNTGGTSYPKSGGSGGGGGSSSRRSSGGGGSSYVPGIGSRANIPNTPNAAVTRSSRTYDTNFDYLRPGVDTKGSRDAYKRGDM